MTGGFVSFHCDLRMVGGHDLGHQLLHVGGLHPVGGIQPGELLLEERVVHLDGLADVDELVGGLLEALLLHEQLLVELLAGAQAGVLDGDVHVGLVAGQADQVPGHVVDLDRLAHVQHEDLTALGVVARLEHQADGFGDGHEVADDPGVRDGDGAAGLDLLLEQGDDGAVGAQDVAEADGHELRLALPVHHLHHHLAQTLAGTHDVGGVHGLVGGDQHEPLDAVGRGGLGHLVGAEDVVLDGLVGAVLHQGDMLVGRGVEDQLRSVGIQHIVHAGGVPDGADEGHQIQVGITPLELHLDVVGVVLVDVEDDELLGVGLGDLAAQLAADAAAAAGDHDHLAGDEIQDLVQIDLDGVPAQQVLDIDLAQAADGDITVDQLVDAGHHLDLTAGGGANVEEFLPGLGRAGGDGVDDAVDGILLHGGGDLLPAAHDGHAAQPLAPLHGVVVDETADPALDVGAVGELGDQSLTGLTGTDDEHIFLVIGMTQTRQMLAYIAQHPPAEADGQGEQPADGQAHDVEGLGHLDLQQQSQHIGHDGQHQIALQHPHELIGADEAPDAAVQTQEAEHTDADGAPGQDHPAVSLQILRLDGVELEIKPQPQGRKKGDADTEHIHRRDDESLFPQRKIKALSFVYHNRTSQ